MIQRHFNRLLFFCSLFFCLLGNIYSQPFSQDMKRLCAVSDQMDFVPLVESIRSPNKDPLLNGIELGSDFEETTKLLAGRHPDSILILEATPFIYASIAGNWQAAKALLSAGADINFKASIEITPLEMAVTKSHFPMACNLIARGAKLPASNAEKNQLMRSTIAMEPRDAEWGAIFLEHLILNGFNVNEFGTENSNPLMGAVSLHNIPAIKVLLKHGARLDDITKDGRTVWTVAYKKNNPRVIKLLKETDMKAEATKATGSK